MPGAAAVHPVSFIPLYPYVGAPHARAAGKTSI